MKPYPTRSLFTPSFFLALFVLTISVTAFTLGTRYAGVPYLDNGPAKDNTFVTRSLVERGGFEPPEFRRLHVYHIEMSLKHDVPLTQNRYAYGFARTLLPVESLITSILAVPFFLVLGDLGFWFFNLLSILTIYFSISSIVNALSEDFSPFTLCIILLIGTQILLYSHSYSPDLIGAAIVVAGLALARRFPLFGGFVLSLSAFVNLHSISLLPFLAFAWPSHSPIYRRNILLGIGIGTASLLVYNQFLWSYLFSTSYDHIPTYIRGLPIILEPPDRFSWKLLLHYWSTAFFGVHRGIFLYNPVLFLVPIACILIRKGTRKRFCLLVCLAALAQSYLSLSIPEWYDPTPGNRLLFPALLLFSIPVCLLIGSKVPSSSEEEK